MQPEMNDHLMYTRIRDRQELVRDDVHAQNQQPITDHPALRRLGALMIRAGERLQALGREELTRERALT